MKSRCKKLILLSQILLALIFSYFFFKKSFLEYKVISNPYFSNLTHPLFYSNLNEKRLEVLLKQEYRYLDEGCQSFVFASPDDEYVLKLLKYPTLFPLFSKLSFLKKVTIYRLWLEKKKISVISSVDSFNNSIKFFPDESAIAVFAVNSDALRDLKIKVIDRLGIHHLIPFSKTIVILQKKGSSFSETLLNSDNKKQEDLLNKLFCLIKKRRSCGFIDKDPNLIKNVGFQNDQPLLIDVGGLMKTSDSKKFSREVEKIEFSLIPWIKKNTPTHLEKAKRLLIELKTSDLKIIEKNLEK